MRGSAPTVYEGTHVGNALVLSFCFPFIAFWTTELLLGKTGSSDVRVARMVHAMLAMIGMKRFALAIVWRMFE